MTDRSELILAHYEKNWGKCIAHERWTEGPFYELSSDFSVIEFKPRPQREMWTYATCGMWDKSDLHKIELHLFSPFRDRTLVELLTVVAHYHKTGEKLNLHHTMNFGRPWLEGSSCSYGFISLPYLDGPNLEILRTDEYDISFYWIIPITEDELKYAKKNGVEALEKKFEEIQLP